jgi:hypothetical protein
MKHKCLAVFVLGILPLLYAPSEAVAQLSSFAVLAGSTVTNTNTPTIVTGNLGVSPGSAVTGFPPGIVTGGTIHAADAVAAQAQTDRTALYNQLASATCNTDLTGQDLGGRTLTPAVYCFSSSAQLTGTLTLDGQGNSAAVFLFKIGSTLTTASAASVLDQRCIELRSVLAGRQLRDPGHGNRVGGEHRRAHQHHFEYRRKRERKGLGTEWRHDVG